ncbi:guanyl-nucleotide exchange factor [Pyrenophora seminiperda CCB06]|uniref:Guanyl-nucleotide exchange factor n=1 Tax=Pyrenophora seminiperda CCB06 TaxID=1302712 RepID=A0A3M7LWG9_9PLEO|nr:guanyl-nucleotide exchange factor [Pyrenophora seminiperda CCB06]
MNATITPQRRDMASQHSPSKTLTRHALSHLTPSAINTCQNQIKAYEASGLSRAQTPLKHLTTHIPPSFQDKENLATPDALFKGKKRGIEEVDSVETIESLKMLARSGDGDAVGAGMRLTTEAVQRHAYNYIGLADPGSPTERATPSPEPEPMHPSQNSNQSFSDLLNYEMCASQKSEHGATNHATVPPAAPAPPSSQEKRRSRAEQLRTRLKFGLYKVKTNQVTKRDADIIRTYEASTSHSHSYSLDALNASRSAAIASSRESLDAYQVPNITVSSPRREQAPVFVQANLDPFRPISKLGAAPIQFAMPEESFQTSSHMLQGYEPSSSPPPAASLASMSGYKTRNEVKEETAHKRLQRLKQQQFMDGSISSGLQDNAAKGLIQLMQGRP